METTLVIVKPNVMRKNQAGAVIQKFQQAGFKLSGLKLMKISPDLCKEFYAEHKDRPFFSELVQFMSSVPLVVLALSGEGVVSSVRTLMGHTDPKKPDRGPSDLNMVRTLEKMLFMEATLWKARSGN